MDRTDWHIFLTVAKKGSTLSASRVLGISQSSVLRRVEALEKALGLRLFDRSPSGYLLTPGGTVMVAKAEAVVFAMNDAIVAAAQQARNLSGGIRFTTLEAFCQTFAVAAIQEFRSAHSDVWIELIASDRSLDLGVGEADVALRAGPQPNDPKLVIRRVFDDGWSVYCPKAYADRNGVPGTPEELAKHAIISLPKGFQNAPMAHWVDATVPEDAIILRSNGVPGLLAGLKSGSGVSLMSDMVAETDSSLIRCFVPPVEMQVPIWLVTTEALRHEPRIKALMGFFDAYLRARRFAAIDR